jgi:23S rRNA (pseudouridine1915-N3)-methyltransferase
VFNHPCKLTKNIQVLTGNKAKYSSGFAYYCRIIPDTLKIKYISFGKADDTYLAEGIRDYTQRINRYVPFEHIQIPSGKSSLKISQKENLAKEAGLINKYLQGNDVLIILDERGKEIRSVEFAALLNKHFASGQKVLVFVSGGPFGVDDSLKKRAFMILSLSKMTFSHQMVKLFFVEQFYRAMTILGNESYHHD